MNSISLRSSWMVCLVGFATLLLWCGVARAEALSAAATLSSDTVAMGEEVELQVTVEGSQKAEAPEVRVEGLDIRYVGPFQQIQMNNFEVTRSVRHTYSVVPRKEGVFTIPALTVNVGGKKLSTQPLKLAVSNTAGSVSSGGVAQGGGSAQSAAGAGKFAFAEWILPKTSLYVGEAVPLELRLYVDQKIRCELQPMAAISADGFSIQKMDKPQQRVITKDGREIAEVIFKTAITPVKSGSLTLPAAELNLVAYLPVNRPRAPRMPQGFNSLFDDPVFNSAFNAPQQVVVRAEPVELAVKPLPATGRPHDFSGAVGQFTMETKAAPSRVHAGDPVTLTSVIKGIGSFDRMNAPTVAETPGWRAYPPSGKFKAEDAAGISGEKTFEMALIPETPQTELPPVTFSFFNPSSERYETLAGERIALTVEGPVAASTTPGTAAPASAVAAAAATPAAAPQPTSSDIQYLRLDPGARTSGFEPVWRSRPFWLAQALAFAGLLGLGGWQWRQARNQDGALWRAAALRREKAQALEVLRRESTPLPEFYDAAIRLFQLETALGRVAASIDPATVDAEAACASRPLDCETMEGVRRIFAAHDELRYAGTASGGGGTVYPDQRARVLQIFEQFETCHV